MLVLKSIHIAAAVFWLGNFVVTGIWSMRAFATGKGELRAFAVREILFTDVVFTLVFGAAVTITGISLASLERIAVLQTMWTSAGLWAVVAAGTAWATVLLPLELRMQRLASAGNDAALNRLFMLWSVVGWLVTAVLFGVIYLMVGKPA
ncbi:MAG: DUF2269 domain-containing protein [Candidatus Eremiobacteraeota bacterium]|nr:DUF2269 domain-containing protein [Candidatus Eremiobacteraeota bacterium]